MESTKRNSDTMTTTERPAAALEVSRTFYEFLITGRSVETVRTPTIIVPLPFSFLPASREKVLVNWSCTARVAVWKYRSISNGLDSGTEIMTLSARAIPNFLLPLILSNARIKIRELRKTLIRVELDLRIRVRAQ